MTSPSYAIADTSYLSALCRIGLLEILRLRFPQVTIPGAVLEELNTSADEIIRNEIGQALQAG
jgi:predicted nucleic acid-binding protein